VETQEPRRPAQGQTAEVDDDGQGASSTADGFALIEAPDTGPVEEPRRALDADEDKIAFVQGADLLGDGLPDVVF
jgi:hypothetical protein